MKNKSYKILADYGGQTTLDSDTSYFWKVRYFDSIGARSQWSEIREFRMGLKNVKKKNK